VVGKRLVTVATNVGCMMFAKVFVSGMMCVAACGLVACSDDDGGSSGGGDRYGNRQIDTSNFQNSASESEFKQKGSEVDTYFEDMKEVKKPFLASGAGNNLLGRMISLVDEPAPQSTVAIDPNAGTCSSEYEQEETDDGRLLMVETKTCVNEIEGGTSTCVTITKKTFDDSIVQNTYSCSSTSSTDTTDTTDTTDSTDIQIGGGHNQYVPNFSDVQDCESAFRVFDDSYDGVKAEFDNVYGMLTQPDDGLSLAGANLNDVGTLKKVESDAKGAVTYQFVAPESNGGMKLTGTISGGANETTLLIRQKVSVAFDMNDMFQGMPQPSQGDSQFPASPAEPAVQPSGIKMSMDSDGSIAVDTTAKLIEQDVDMKMGMHMDGMDQVTTAKGRMTISAGDDKFVRAKLDLGMAAKDSGFNASLDMESRLVDASTLTFRAKMNGSGDGAPQGEMSFDLVRTADGECQVKNEKNTMTQSAAKPQDQSQPKM
jgi:hypothetical protein